MPTATTNVIQPNTTVPVTPTGSYKRYVALLNQTGTAAPVATVLENNLPSESGDIVWTRLGAGDYLGSATGGFPAGRTLCMCNINQTEEGYQAGGIGAFIKTNSTEDSVNLTTGDLTSGYDDQLINTPIEIRVYN